MMHSTPTSVSVFTLVPAKYCWQRRKQRPLVVEYLKSMPLPEFNCCATGKRYRVNCCAKGAYWIKDTLWGDVSIIYQAGRFPWPLYFQQDLPWLLSQSQLKEVWEVWDKHYHSY